MRLATTFLIILMAIAATAGAATRRGSGDAAGLRGSQAASVTGAASPTASAAARLRKPATPTPPLAGPLPTDDGQCRRTCAASYYRCLAGDYAEQCPQAWTLCRADCARAAAALR